MRFIHPDDFIYKNETDFKRRLEVCFRKNMRGFFRQYIGRISDKKLTKKEYCLRRSVP